jgi:hypothetical protein
MFSNIKYLRFAEETSENLQKAGMEKEKSSDLSIGISRALDSLYNDFVRLATQDRKIFGELFPDIVKELYFYAKATNQNTSVFTEHEYSEVAA